MNINLSQKNTDNTTTTFLSDEILETNIVYTFLTPHQRIPMFPSNPSHAIYEDSMTTLSTVKIKQCR